MYLSDCCMLPQARSVQLGFALVIVLVIVGIGYINQSMVAVDTSPLRAERNLTSHAQKRDSAAKAAVAAHIKPTNNTSYIVCAILKEEDLYVEEWILYHLYLGFQTFELYDNDQNGSVVLSQLAQKYGPAIQLHNISGDGMQKTAYNLCTKQYANQSVFGAFIDCDEFIVLRNHTNIADFLAEVAPNGEAVSLSWIRFGSNGHLKYENAPVLSRFTNRSVGVSENGKTISFLPGVKEMDVHFPRMRPGYHRIDAHGTKYVTSKLRPGNEDVAAIHHYFTKSLQEFQHKRMRGFGQNWRAAAKYHRSEGEALVKAEFNKSESYANAVRDTRALDFFVQHQHLQQLQRREYSINSSVTVMTPAVLRNVTDTAV